MNRGRLTEGAVDVVMFRTTDENTRESGERGSSFLPFMRGVSPETRPVTLRHTRSGVTSGPTDGPGGPCSG